MAQKKFFLLVLSMLWRTSEMIARNEIHVFSYRLKRQNGYFVGKIICFQIFVRNDAKNRKIDRREI